jgi:hypothetical protein
MRRSYWGLTGFIRADKPLLGQTYFRHSAPAHFQANFQAELRQLPFDAEKAAHG